MMKKIIAATVLGTTALTMYGMKVVGATIKDFGTHADLIRGTYFGERTTWTVNGIKVIGVYSPITVLSCNALYAAANYDAYGNIVVIYDKNFTKLSTEEQYAVICHEAGHMYYKHDYRVRKLENEIAADNYAVAVVGKETMISVLKKIYAHRYGKNKEIATRINALA